MNKTISQKEPIPGWGGPFVHKSMCVYCQYCEVKHVIDHDGERIETGPCDAPVGCHFVPMHTSSTENGDVYECNRFTKRQEIKEDIPTFGKHICKFDGNGWCNCGERTEQRFPHDDVHIPLHTYVLNTTHFRMTDAFREWDRRINRPRARQNTPRHRMMNRLDRISRSHFRHHTVKITAETITTVKSSTQRHRSLVY